MDHSNLTPRVAEALYSLVDQGGANKFRAGVDFFSLLRRVFPGAQPKTLRMFEVWCQEYDDWLDRNQHTEKVIDTFITNDSRPVLPTDEIARIRREFTRLAAGNTTIDNAVLETYFGAAGAAFDQCVLTTCCDGDVDEMTFLRIVCPPEYRVPVEGIAEVRDAFRELLAFHRNVSNVELDKVQAGSLSTWNRRAPQPDLLCPLVSQQQWTAWEALFNRMDRTQSGDVSFAELVSSHAFSEEESRASLDLLDPDKTGVITKDAFFRAMLKATGKRLADPSGAPL